MNLKKGDLFLSTQIGGDVEIKATRVDLIHNEVDIEYFDKAGVKHLDMWDLDAVIHKLEKGEYIKINKQLPHRSKHGQMENEGAYAE